MSEPAFLLDENVPISLAKFLLERGYEVRRLAEVGLRGAEDRAVAEYAADRGLILVTLDKDFGLLYRRLYEGRITIVLIRVDPPTPERIVEVTSRLLRSVSLSEVGGRLVVVSERKVRVV